MALLEIRDLSVSFRVEAGDLPAVRHVSLDVEKGETLGIVGESGSGKSVTALSVLQLLPYPKAYHPSGSIRLGGQEILGAPPSVLNGIRGNRVSMIFQEPMTALNPLHTIRRQIAETLLLHRHMTREQAHARVLELLAQVGLEGFEHRVDAYPHTLSGGQRQRVMIAMAIANTPEILIADEPTTALDVTVQKQILALLKDLQRQTGMAMLMITHDLGLVRRLADRVAVMKDGEIVETAAVEQLFSAPQHPYTRALLGAEPKGHPVPVAAGAAEIVASEKVNVDFPLKRGFFGNVLQSLRAVEEATLTVRAGETLGIVGESGSGKTTLALALLRLVKSSGIIRFEGAEIQHLSWKQARPLRRHMQVVFQDPFASLNPRMTIGQIVAEGLEVHAPSLSAPERDKKVEEALEEVGLAAAMKSRYPHEFSGGQRQRISIARALILTPKLIVLDEPTSALDVSVQAQLLELLAALQQKHGLSYIFISHDLRVIRAISHRIVVMRQGRILEQGETEALFSAPREAYTRDLIEAAFLHTRY